VNDFYEKKADGAQTEIHEFGNFFGSEDFIEGTTAFQEKRKANFMGK
jgi:enoyl-CoA hydratase